jgi:hypothetical protein
MLADDGDHRGEHGRVVGVADHRQDVGDRIHGQDEIGERGHHHALGRGRGLRIPGAEPHGQQVLGEWDLGGDLAELGPESPGDPLFIDPDRGRNQGLPRVQSFAGVETVSPKTFAVDVG